MIPIDFSIGIENGVIIKPAEALRTIVIAVHELLFWNLSLELFLNGYGTHLIHTN